LSNTKTTRQQTTAESKFSYKKAYILFSMMAFCTLFYYFGEIVDAAGWQSLHLSFFYSVHDIHRLLFLAPILYTAHNFSPKAVIIISLITAGIFLPRALVFSPYPDPILRAETFAVIAGITGYLVALTLDKNRKIARLERTVTNERDRLLSILENMSDGIMITGPDYIIRYVNPVLIKEFGPGKGSYCYKYLHRADKPCEGCRLPALISGEITQWLNRYPDGKIFETKASPFVDTDGTTCQISAFRIINTPEQISGQKP